MPVFHTKTIESILDPVAQQVNPFFVKNVIKFYSLIGKIRWLRNSNWNSYANVSYKNDRKYP